MRRLGTSYAHPLVVLIFLNNNLTASRFAVSAGVSVGNAVQRNRAKRLIRAALLDIIPEIKDGYDILLIAREPLVNTDCQQTRKALQSLFDKAQLL